MLNIIVPPTSVIFHLDIRSFDLQFSTLVLFGLTSLPHGPLSRPGD